MNKRKNLVTCIIIVVLIGIFLSSCEKINIASGTAGEKEEGNKVYYNKYFVFEPKTYNNNSDLSYIEIVGLADKDFQQSVNNEIINFVSTESQKEEITGLSVDGECINGFLFLQFMTKTDSNASFRTKAYNLKTNKEIKINDLFYNEVDYAAVIRKFANETIERFKSSYRIKRSFKNIRPEYFLVGLPKNDSLVVWLSTDNPYLEKSSKLDQFQTESNMVFEIEIPFSELVDISPLMVIGESTLFDQGQQPNPFPYLSKNAYLYEKAIKPHTEYSDENIEYSFYRLDLSKAPEDKKELFEKANNAMDEIEKQLTPDKLRQVASKIGIKAENAVISIEIGSTEDRSLPYKYLLGGRYSTVSYSMKVYDKNNEADVRYATLSCIMDYNINQPAGVDTLFTFDFNLKKYLEEMDVYDLDEIERAFKDGLIVPVSITPMNISVVSYNRNMLIGEGYYYWSNPSGTIGSYSVTVSKVLDKINW